jgi:hypothetical protein
MTKGRLTSFACAWTTAALLLMALPVRAQDPAAPPPPLKKFSFYAGYAFLHTDDGDLHGFSLSPEYRFNGLLSAVVDIGAGKGTLDGASTTITTFLGGLRVRKATGSAGLFLHALAGGARTSSSIDLFDGISLSVADTGLAFGGGAGVEFKVSRVKLRVGADYLVRQVDAGGDKTENRNDIRAGIGLVF